MQRPSATAVLLLVAAFARAAAVVLVAPDLLLDARTLVLALDVVVPLAIAVADLRGRAAAPTAAVALGALGAGTLVANGLQVLVGGLALTGPVVAFLAASTAAMLAGAAAIGRWQDHGAPVPGPARRRPRLLGVLGALGLCAVLVTEDVAVLGAVPVPGGTLPGPVAIATTLQLARLPLLVAALLPMAWATTRADLRHLRAVALVLGARAVVETVADASLLALDAPVWPTVAGATAVALLLVAVPATAQVTSSSA